MADVQQTYKFKFEFDRKDIKKQLNGIAGDVQEAIARMGDASDKVVIFKDLVKYLSNVDKALDVFKSKHKNDFDDLFGNPDASILSVLEEIFGATEKSAQAFVDLKKRMAEASAGKSDLRVWKGIAKDINELYESMGKEAPIKNIDGLKNTEATIKMITDELDRFGETYATFQDKLRGGFGGGLSKEVQEEINKLKKQKKQYEELLDFVNGSSATIKTSKSQDVEQLQNMINKFNEAKEAVEKFETANNTSSEGYKKALAEAVKMATLLRNTMDYVAENGSDEGAFFVANQSGAKGALTQVTNFLDKFKTSNVFKDIQVYLNEQIQIVNNQLNQLSQPDGAIGGGSGTSGVVTEYDKLLGKVKEYLEVRKQINEFDGDKKSDEAKALANKSNQIAAEIQAMKQLDSNQEDLLYDVFDEANEDGANLNVIVEKLCNIFQIDIPKASGAAADAAGSAFAKITKGANDAADAAKNMMYHLGNLLNGKGKARDTFGDMADNLTKEALGTRWEQYGFGVFGGGLFGVSDPSTMDQEPGMTSFIQSIDLSKYNMYMADTEARATALMDFLSKLQKFSMKSAEPNYAGFDEHLKGANIDSLYDQFKVVFEQSELTKEQFQAFINEMTSILKQAGLAFDAQTGELDFTNLTEEVKNSENISTRFMKMLGYQGINVTGTSFDGFGQGSVLFDFDKSDIVGYFNSIKDAVEDYQKIINSTDDNQWVGSTEQLKQYALNIDAIINKIEEYKSKGKIKDIVGADETLEKLYQIRLNISDILAGKNVSSNAPFETITAGVSTAGQSIEATIKKYNEFLSTCETLQKQLTFEDVDIGRLLAELKTTREELEKMAALGYLNEQQFVEMSKAFESTESWLEHRLQRNKENRDDEIESLREDWRQAEGNSMYYLERSSNAERTLEILEKIAEVDKQIAATHDHQVDELDSLIQTRKEILNGAELENVLSADMLDKQKAITAEAEERSKRIHSGYDIAYKDFYEEFGDLSKINFSKLNLNEVSEYIDRLSELYAKLKEADGNYLLGDFDKIEVQYNAAMNMLQRTRAKFMVGAGNGQQINDDELDDIIRENGALEDKLELLREIADQYGVNIDKRKRDSYEKLNQKDMDSGLNSREEDRFSELGETINEADENLMEFEERYDRIVLKLSNGKKLEILPNDKGLRDLYHISDNYGTYQGYEIDDIQFIRHQQVKETGQSIDLANKKLEEFLALAKEISDKSFYQIGDATDNVEIGKYTEKLTAAKNELEELGKQGLLTSEQIGYVNDAFVAASNHLDMSTRAYDDYSSSHGYDYSYYDEYREQRDRADAAEAEAERLSEELSDKKLETPNGQRKLFEDIADDSVRADNAVSELNDELRETRELDGQISIDDYISEKESETAQKVKDESNAVSQEAETLEELRKKLIEVKEAVATKTKAFYDEGTVVGQVVGKEVAALTKLLEIVDKIAPKVEAMATNMAAIGPIDLVQQTVGTGTDDTNITPQNAFKSRVDHKKGAMTSYIEGLKGVQYVADETRQELIDLREMMDSVKTPDGLNAIVTKFEELQKEIGLAKKNFEDINLNKVNKEKSKLFGVYNGLTRDQQKDLEPELKQAIAQLNRYEADIKEGKKIELDAIEAVTHALRQKLETYQQVNKEAKKQTSGIKADNSKFGETISINAAAKYNRLSKIATDQFSNSREVSAVLAEYTKYYDKMNNLRDTLRSKNKNDITSEDRESFKAARDKCNEYAKALEKLINNSLKLHGEKANKEDYMLGADFNYSNTDMRKAALTDFAKEMYGVNVAATDFKDNWSKVVFAVDNGDGTFTQMTATFTDARNEIVAMAGDTKEVQSALSNFISGFKGRVKSLAQYFLATISIYDAIRVLRQGVQYVKEIDIALTELKKVTDETDATYRRFLQTASQTGAKIGSTVADLVNATADFARLGYNIEEAASLAEAASVYKNVGDGIDDITTASESIISTMKAFGIEADNAMGIVDRFNEIGNNFAISSTGIGEAMQRSASALFEAGNTIDESIALITGANSVVQNPEQVGELIAHQHSNMLLVNSYIG